MADIEKIKVKGTDYTVVDSTVPSHVRTITQQNITNWNNKLDSYTETDPTVPAWAKQSTKPSYSYSEISGTPTLANVATSGSYTDLSNKPTIPSAPGTLNTNNTSAQTVSSSEALSGAIKLHKVSKTGSYDDLNNKPSIPSAPGTLNTTATTAQSTAASEALSGSVTLHKVAKTGTYSDLIGTPTIGNATLTIQKNGTTVKTFTANATSNVTANITVPTKVSDLTNDSGFISSYTESDPVFLASAASGITSTDISNWNSKQAALVGSGTGQNIKTVNSNSLLGTGNISVGTITGITMNSVSKGTSGVVDLGTVITSETQLSKGTTSGSGNAVTDISVSGHQITLTKGSTFLTSHQGIKSLNTTNTSSLSTSASETINGTGTINLHKVAKTGSYDDLVDYPQETEIISVARLDSSNTVKVTPGGGIGNHLLLIRGSGSTASYQVTAVCGQQTYEFSTTDGKMNINQEVEWVDTYTANYTLTGSPASDTEVTVILCNETGNRVKSVSQVAITSDYNDLINKPTIPSVPASANTRAYTTSDCSTAVGTAAKTAACTGYTLQAGNTVTVKFTNGNTNSAPTLSVNSTTAKAIKYQGSNPATTLIKANDTVTFIYDGTNYNIISIENETNHNLRYGFAFGACTTARATVAKTVTLSNYELVNYGVVAVHFTNGTSANNPTLNINSKGAKSIVSQDGTSNTVQCDPGDTVLFMYNGTSYKVLGVIPSVKTTGTVFRAYCQSQNTNVLVATAYNNSSQKNWANRKIPTENWDGIPVDGTIVAVTYKYDYNHNSPATLNVTGTGDYPIIYAGNNENTKSNRVACGSMGRTVYYMFSRDTDWTDSDQYSWVWMGQDMDKDTTYDYEVLDVLYDANNEKCVYKYNQAKDCPAHTIYEHINSHREVRLWDSSDNIFQCVHAEEYYDFNTETYDDCVLIFTQYDAPYRTGYLIRCDYFRTAPDTSTNTPGTWTESWTKNSYAVTNNKSVYSTCSTSGSSAGKTVLIGGYKETAGDVIAVKFNNANTAANATVSISASGSVYGTPHTIRYMGSSLTSSTAGIIGANTIVTFQYDGTYMNILNVWPEGGAEAIPIATVEGWFA